MTSRTMQRTVGLAAAGLALLVPANLANYAISQTFNPPSSHTVELGIPGFFTALHKPGFDNPLDPASGCTFCHGGNLKGDFGPSCYTCHGAFWDPSQPQYPDSHIIGSYFMHGEGRNTPFDSGCTLCHGPNLDGVNGIAPSCFSCHGEVWEPAAGNQPPLADPNGPYSGQVGQAVPFDGSGSTDPDGTIVAYDWDFGDGGSASGVSPTHTYSSAGSYTVALTVTDDAGATDSATTTAEISGAANEPPLADPNGPYSGQVGQAVSFDGSGSTDPDGTIVAYDWDFGDGSSASGVSPGHSYASAGLYTVTLTVTDDAGASATASTIADISAPANQPPVADAGGPYSGTAGEPIPFDGSASFDPDGTIIAYLWDFGDGASGTGATPTHAYADEGTFTVTLTVADDGGQTSSATTTVEITAAGGGEGNRWTVMVPFLQSEQSEFTLTLEPFGPVLLITEDFSDGTSLFGVGIQADPFIVWLDVEGAMFFGFIDEPAGSMQGMVWNFFGISSIWFAERQP